MRLLPVPAVSSRRGCSNLNRIVVNMAARLGEVRSEREVAMWVFHYNHRIDLLRGLSTEDIFMGEYWRELELQILWGTCGRCPGGTQLCPDPVRAAVQLQTNRRW